MGQGIERVLFTSQEADEPPTKQERPKYAIEYSRLTSGGLMATNFSVDGRKIKLKNKIAIEKERIEKIANWRGPGKTAFSQSDLGFNVSELMGQNSYKLNFDIPRDLVIQIDSFQFCQVYKMTKGISIGGERLTVTMTFKGGQVQEFVFDSNDIGAGSFRIKDYILCYALLVNKLPNEVPGYDFFTRKRLNHMVLLYQKTVECEGFYYKEFTDKNPNMTAKDRRMMTGWNFVEYMSQRTTKE